MLVQKISIIQCIDGVFDEAINLVFHTNSPFQRAFW